MRKTVLTIIGSLLIVAGLAMLALPGPGLLVIAIGLAVLASAGVMWAARLLVRARERLPESSTAADDRATQEVDDGEAQPGMVHEAVGRLDDAMADLEAVQQVEEEDRQERERQHEEALVTTDEAVQDGAARSRDMQARIVHEAGGEPPAR
ncbi:PGPGW domain-containing protein [Salsipaludibacter albus]|uniref:PGPGW domain-containing protein n=1 Tax=Salsipaludibacter albus TaxID=2849650 RepID=UPI001EE44FF2|nr:PGPGW domain-containing protein [Salsipaludibacter albus]MBY5161969.1 PGPGW domain-containing protein [Salsipaludibacter albus]